MVRDFQAVISNEARQQIQDAAGRLPDSVIACAGGGSNTMGSFQHFRDDPSVALYAVEAGGSSLAVDEDAGVAPNSASLSTGDEGVLHGARTKLLQDSAGQIMESHSVSAGLDYAGVGPELAHLVDEGRVEAVTVDDDAALEAFHRLSRDEGVIPALETAHAVGYLEEHQDELGDIVLVTVSGRGDKDLETVIEETAARDLQVAPDMDVFRQVGTGGGGL
jgi:tryptophan synthase beta chain